MISRILHCVGIAFIFCKLLDAQNETGLPFVRNYTPKEYGAFAQNWAVTQDDRGIMYFANNRCVLEYDGSEWRRIEVPHPGVRSIVRDSSGTIYAGCNGDFGYLLPDSTGKMRYLSLAHLVDKKDSPFSEVFSICATSDGIYFQCRTILFRYDGKRIRSWRFNDYLLEAVNAGNRLILLVKGVGLCELVDDSVRVMKDGDRFKNDGPMIVVPYDDRSLLIASSSQGLFIYDREGVHTLKEIVPNAEGTIDQKTLSNSRLYFQGILLSNGNFAFPTQRSGVLILNREGRTVQKLDQSVGLENQTVYFVYEDRQHILWMALENGIARAEIQAPVSLWGGMSGLRGSILSILRYQGRLYVGTHLGLFYYENNRFEMVKGLSTFTTALCNFEASDGSSRLLAGTGDGIYEIDKFEAKLIAKDYACRALGTYSATPDEIYAGLWDGLACLRFEKGKWKDKKRIPNVKGQVRVIREDSGYLWLCTANNGVVRLSKKEDRFEVANYDSNDGLADLSRVKVVKSPDGLIFATEKGMQIFDYSKNRFSYFNSLGNEFTSGATSVTQMGLDRENNYIIRLTRGDERRVEKYHRVGSGFKRESERFIRVPDMEIYTLFVDLDGTVYLGGSDGLVRCDTRTPYELTSSFSTLIRKVVVGGDSVIFEGAKAPKTPVHLPYAANSLIFYFAAPTFEDESKNVFNFYLDGNDENRSNTTVDHKKEYTNLSEGHYVFHVAGKNVYQRSGLEDTFEFVILPPWYRTWWFRFILIAAISAVLYSIYRYRVNRLLAVERLRVKIASDLHDDVGATLSKISMYTELIQSEKNLEESQSMLRQIGSMSRDMVNTMSDIVWSIDARNDHVGNLTDRMQDFAHSVLGKKKINVQFDFSDIDGQAKLRTEVKQNVYLIFKECINNIVKHSGAEAVVVSLKTDRKSIHLMIRDNGKGLDGSGSKSGHGLRNLEMRAKQIKGDIKITSDHGLITELLVPWS